MYESPISITEITDNIIKKQNEQFENDLMYQIRKNYHINDDKEALEFAVKAVEKQIPKKLTIKLQGYLYRDKCCYCPMCDSFRGNLDYEPQKIRKYDFCPGCGQALDWSGEDE